jgi:hypothetical protein
MSNRPIRKRGDGGGRRWPAPSLVVSGVAVFIALSGSAVAAGNLIDNKDLAANAVTGDKIKDHTISVKDLNATLQTALRVKGGTGAAGGAGALGAAGTGGVNGAPGTGGMNGANGPNGAAGAAGANGANGPGGTNGIDGAAGTNGTDGTNGAGGTNGTNGTITPLSATAGVTALPTAAPPTTVISLTAPARTYVVLAKTQLTHSGAGDSIECLLKSGSTTIDRVDMKTLPALAAIPVSLQAIVTSSTPLQLSVVCSVAVANGSADVSSIIAIPVG